MYFASKAHFCSAYWKILLRLSFHGLPPGLSRSDKAFFWLSDFVIFELKMVWGSHHFSSRFSVIGETGWEFRVLFFCLQSACIPKSSCSCMCKSHWWYHFTDGENAFGRFRSWMEVGFINVHSFFLWRPDKPAAFGKHLEQRNSSLFLPYPPAFWNENICVLYPLF